MQSTRIYTILLLTAFLFPATLFSQVFDSGPSDPTSFDIVFNVPLEDPDDPNIEMSDSASVQDSPFGPLVDVPGLTSELEEERRTVQINVSDNTFDSGLFNINQGVELNLELGMDGEGAVNFLTTTSGAEVNISGGVVNNLSVRRQPA